MKKEKGNMIESHSHTTEKNNLSAKDERYIMAAYDEVAESQDQISLPSIDRNAKVPEMFKYEDTNNNSLPHIHENMIERPNNMCKEKVGFIIREFHEFLEDQILLNPEKRSGLLQNLPIFHAIEHSSVRHNNIGKENEPLAFPMQSEQTGSFLLKFLRAGNNNKEYAAKILFNYIRLMRDHPKYYATKVRPELAQNVFDEKIHTVLPERDRFKRRVFIWRPGKWNPDTISFTDCYCAMYMLCEMMAIEPLTQIHGCTVVCDGSGIGLKQLKSMCLEDIRNSANFVQVNSY